MMRVHMHVMYIKVLEKKLGAKVCMLISNSCFSQDCEGGVSLDYLQKLHEEYLEFIKCMR